MDFCLTQKKRQSSSFGEEDREEPYGKEEFGKWRASFLSITGGFQETALTER